tara:strand:+ start:260 stop:1195 length:936 start_codon:yes stop_codon:yes gene_type:complete
MIEVRSLTKFYGPRRAVNDLNFSISKGEVVGFLGPNGAGKTTTMNILSCILPSTSGSVSICGYDIFENSMKIRKTIGYLPEIPPLYPDMIVNDYLVFTAGLRGVGSSEVPRMVKRALEKCSLGDVCHRIVGRLSKGFQQRVGLAQALIHDPDILILDEPTIGLDPIQIIEIRKLIQELATDHTIILSSHILPEITQICKRVIIINEGEIVAVDSLEGLSASLRKTERLELKVHSTGDSISETLESLDSVISARKGIDNQFIVECTLGSRTQDSIARCVLDKGWGLVELKTVSFSLEDIFLKLTTEEKEVKS